MTKSVELKRIWQELKIYKFKLILVAVTGVIYAASDLGIITQLKYVFDGLDKGNTEVIKKTFALIVGLAFVKAVSRYFNFYNMNVISEYVTQSLREQLQKKFMTLNLTFHNTYATGPGGLISRVMNDILVVYHGLRMYSDLFREPILAIGYLGVLFYMNWKLTSGIIIVLPLILIFLKQMSKKIKTYGLQGQQELEKITNTLKESLDGVRTIQSFNLENEMAKKFHEQSNDFLQFRKRLHNLIEMLGPVTEFTMYCVVFTVMLVMSLQIAAGHATLGDAVVYFGSLLAMQSPVKKAQESYVRVQETMVSLKRALEIIDAKQEVPQLQSTQSFPKNWNFIQYDNVSFKYGDELVLKKINLTIPKGEVIAFVGASGSGKSTLVNLLERFFEPTEGQIKIDKTPVHQFQLKDLRKNIALVTQDVFLFSDTIENNIWAGDFTKDKTSVPSAAKSANADSFIQKTPLQYKNKVGDRGNLLSGGEKQRVSIARAVFKDAPILILDEATSALDSQSEAEVQKGLDALMQGRTALIIAHRLSTIAKAHRICVMKDGEIVEMGTHSELLQKQGEYFRLYQMQSLG